MNAMLKAFFPKNVESSLMTLLFLFYCMFIILSPLGRAFISIPSVAACVLIFVLLVFVGKKAFVFPQKPIFYLFVALLLWFVVKTIFSLEPSESFEFLRTSMYKGFIYFLLGLVIAKSKKYILFLPFIFFITITLQGIDGTYQFFSGASLFLEKSLKSGRLTASFGSYNIGNYLILCLFPALALRWKLPSAWPAWRAWLVILILFSPAIFLILFGNARTAYMGFFVALTALYLVNKGFSVKFFLALLVIIGCIFYLGLGRVSLPKIYADGRIKELWPFAIEVIKQHPITGAGLGMFNTAFREIGLVPKMHEMGVPHPHNIYLQLLCDTGIVGLILYCSFAGSIVWKGWCVLRVKFNTLKFQPYWIIVSLLWASCVAFLAMAFFGHNLFKDWWLALSMLLFGLTAGACSQTETTD